MRYKKTKYWVFIKPNFLLTMKSKNSRMGSGVGSYIRVCSVVKADKPLLLFKHHSLYFMLNSIKYLKLKLNINLHLNHLYL